MSNITLLREIDTSKIVSSEPILNKTTNNVLMKLWYKSKINPQTFLIQLGQMKIFDCDYDKLYLIIKPETLKYFEAIDNVALSHVKSKELIRKFNTNMNLDKKPCYNAIVNTKKINDEQHINLIVIDLNSNDDQPVLVFNNQKELMTKEVYINSLIKDNIVNAIIEIQSTEYDIGEQKLHTKFNVRQLLVSEIKPLVIKLSEFSFADEEYETSLENKQEKIIKEIPEKDESKDYSDIDTDNFDEIMTELINESNQNEIENETELKTSNKTSNEIVNETTNKTSNESSDNEPSDNDESDKSSEEYEESEESESDHNNSKKKQNKSKKVESDSESDSSVEESESELSSKESESESSSEKKPVKKSTPKKPQPKLFVARKTGGKKGRR
jgi:hypothetical protein